jgi:hypothetical protein
MRPQVFGGEPGENSMEWWITLTKILVGLAFLSLIIAMVDLIWFYFHPFT